jgi:phosphodiesterase/alkaline phosphatase D-like protein
MRKLFLRMVIAVTAAMLFFSIPAATQLSPVTAKAAHVQITQGPETERVDPDFAIITWTSNNPGGSPEHDGIVRYGTDPNNLTEIAKSPIRLNPSHPYTVFRVRMPGLKPKTTYYYTVASMEANGNSDQVKSPVRHFTTP